MSIIKTLYKLKKKLFEEKFRTNLINKNKQRKNL